MGSQIQQQRQLLSAIHFEAFPYCHCFRILTSAKNFRKTLFDKFHVKSEDWAGEYPRGHDSPAEISIQWFQNTKFSLMNKYGEF